jgi:hypothetical protein
MAARAVLLESQEDQPRQHMAGFREDLAGYVAHYTDLWACARCVPPTPDLAFSPEQQHRNEREVDRLIGLMEKTLPDCPDDAFKREAWRERLLREVRKVAGERLGYSQSHLSIIFSPAYFSVTREFVHEAKSFDSAISPEALSQALRNVWVMNWIQMFLGQAPSVSPSVFAYSLLYPYTDNFLDQSDIPSGDKAALNRDLALRLTGNEIQARGPHDRAIFNLIAMIEGEYPRGEFPEVYASLLAIHAGQIKSLMQQGMSPTLSPGQTLRVSIEKGGASVLADGYLVAGRLPKEDAAFCFGLGVLLQLFDDLQDLESDLAAMRWTIFSSRAHQDPLDTTTSRLYWYMERVLAPSVRGLSSRRGVLTDLLRKNCLYLMLRGLAQSRRFYTAEYLKHMESFSPLRFGYLDEQSQALEGRYTTIMGTLLAKRNISSIFDLLD